MSNADRYPKSKRRKMRRFELTEISAVDNPAQKGAVATIMKRAADMCMTGAPEMIPIEELQRELAAMDRKVNVILKGKPREYEFYGDGGAEFEKEPEDDDVATSENDGKGGVPYQGKPRRGDWPPGSDTPGPGSMTPERASQVLQRYADHSAVPEEDDPRTESDALWSRLEDEEDEDELDDEMLATFDATAKRLMREDRRISAERADLMAAARTHDAVRLGKRLNAFAKGNAVAMPVMGREREYAKRIQAAAIQQATLRKSYSDSELFERLQKRFGPEAVQRAKRQYGGR